MDSIGGIVSAQYVIGTEVKGCLIHNDNILLSFVGNHNWKEFPATPSKIEVGVTSNTQNGLATYTVAATIYCPRFKLTKMGEFNSLALKKILLKIETVNGDVLIIGDKSNPLNVLVEPLTPSAVNGYSGIKLSISGILTHSALCLVG
jgi:hypothetical protein